MFSLIKGAWAVLLHMFRPRVTIQYPETKPYVPPRWRGRIILSRDPDGGERCVACYLCAVACPVDCIACRLRKMSTAEDIPHFSGSTFRAASFAVFARRHARLLRFSLPPIMR